MKKYIIYCFSGMVLTTFTFGLGDDVYLNNYYKNVWYKDIFGSIKYYIFWVFPYWWLILLISSIVLGVLFYGVKIGIDKLTR